MPARFAVEAGAQNGDSVYPVKNFSAVLFSGNPTLSQTVPFSGEVKPLEHQIALINSPENGQNDRKTTSYDKKSDLIFTVMWPVQELLTRVETSILPKMINATAPDGAPPRRSKTVEPFICRFSWLGCEDDRFMRVPPGYNLIRPGKTPDLMIGVETPYFSLHKFLSSIVYTTKISAYVLLMV